MSAFLIRSVRLESQIQIHPPDLNLTVLSILLEQFVKAGDHLVHHCPSWHWASGDADKLKPYLPADKQFLYTKNVPCYKRCKEIEYIDNHEKVIETEDADGGWVDTHHYSDLVEHIEEMTLNSGSKEPKKEEKPESKPKPSQAANDGN